MNQIRFLLCVALLALSGCTNVAVALDENVAFPDEVWSNSQKHANVQAVVQYDEESRYSWRGVSGLEAAADVGPGELQYRRASLSLVNSTSKTTILNFTDTRALHFVAVVPDGMPLLKRGDMVEVRTGPVYHHLKKFAQTGEGTAILRILCPAEKSKSQLPAFRECNSKLAWYQPWGEDKRYYAGVLAAPSPRPYLPSLKAHTELTFTPYYDESGRVLPNAVPPGPRPDLDGWPAPQRY